MVVYFADRILFFFNRYRLVLPDYHRCFMCSKSAAGISSTNSTSTQVTGTGCLDPALQADAAAAAEVSDHVGELAEASVNDRREQVQADIASAVDADAFEPAPFEEFSDVESDDEDPTTNASSTKNRGGQPGRRAKTKRVALTLAQKVAIIQHYEEHKPMTFPMVVEWVMENFGSSLTKAPSTASISILLNKKKQQILETYRTKQNHKVIRSKRSRRSTNEAQV